VAGAATGTAMIYKKDDVLVVLIDENRTHNYEAQIRKELPHILDNLTGITSDHDIRLTNRLPYEASMKKTGSRRGTSMGNMAAMSASGQNGVISPQGGSERSRPMGRHLTRPQSMLD
jgi:hypothetical protein